MKTPICVFDPAPVIDPDAPVADRIVFIGVDDKNICPDEVLRFDPRDGVMAVTTRGESVPFTVTLASSDTEKRVYEYLASTDTASATATRTITWKAVDWLGVKDEVTFNSIAEYQAYDPLTGVTATTCDGVDLPVTYTVVEGDEPYYQYQAGAETAKTLIKFKLKWAGIHDRIMFTNDYSWDEGSRKNALIYNISYGGRSGYADINVDMSGVDFDNEGTYEVTYSAPGSPETRTVKVYLYYGAYDYYGYPSTAMCYLYADGTLVLNEMPEDHDANVAAHGNVVKQRGPLRLGTYYVFVMKGQLVAESAVRELWSYRHLIRRVEFGSPCGNPWFTNMFQGCENLVEIDWTNLLPWECGRLEGWFSGCTNWRNIDMSVFKVTGEQVGYYPQQVFSLKNTFRDCVNLQFANILNLDILFKTSSIVCTGTFAGCVRLGPVDMGYDTEYNGSAFSEMFRGAKCGNLIKMPYSNDLAPYFTSCFEDCEVEVIDMTLIMYTRDSTRMRAGGMSNTFKNCTVRTVKVHNTWSTASDQFNTSCFEGAVNIQGAEGFSYDPTKIKADMARKDTIYNEGYFS